MLGSQDGSIRTWLVNEMEIVTVNYKKAKEQREQNPGSVSDAEFKITKSIWRERSTLKCVDGKKLFIAGEDYTCKMVEEYNPKLCSKIEN